MAGKEKKPKVGAVHVTSENEEKDKKQIANIIESKEIAPEDVFKKLNKQQIELIKNTIAKGASDDELKMFLQVCAGARLNPFLKQVFLVPRWDSKSGKEVRAIQVSIDGLRAIAEESGNYAGNSDPIFGEEDKIKLDTKEGKELKIPTKATVSVFKMIDGQKCEFTATARWNEYYPGAKMGFQWHIRPFLMLGKCAEALALRKAFPKLLSGMYAQEEMDNTGTGKQDKTKQGFDLVLNAIEKCKPEELESYKEKMLKSEKYSEDQKKQVVKRIEERLAELSKK